MQLAAKHYYVKYGTESSKEKAKSIVWECLSLNLIENKSEVRLVQLVSTAHEQVFYMLKKIYIVLNYILHTLNFAL